MKRFSFVVGISAIMASCSAPQERTVDAAVCEGLNERLAEVQKRYSIWAAESFQAALRGSDELTPKDRISGSQEHQTAALQKDLTLLGIAVLMDNKGCSVPDNFAALPYQEAAIACVAAQRRQDDNATTLCDMSTWKTDEETEGVVSPLAVEE